MQSGTDSTTYSRQIGWRTLLAYERALREFTASACPKLSFSAFAGLSKVSASNMPVARYFPATDGLKLGYRRYETHSNTHLVLVHGAGCFGDQLHEIAYRVAQSGRAQSYTLNVRGHGLSDGERGHAVTEPDQIISDTAEFLEALKKENPAGKIILAGHSAGGGVVLSISRTPASRCIAGYAFLAPFLGLGSPTVRPFFGGWVSVRKGALRTLSLLNLFGITRFNATTVLDFNMDACLHDPRFVKNWSFNTTLSFGPGRWVPGAKSIPPEVPVILVSGEDDQCFVQPEYREAFQVIAPHADIVAIGGSGHWDMLVSEMTIGALGRWIEEHFPETAAGLVADGDAHAAAA